MDQSIAARDYQAAAVDAAHGEWVRGVQHTLVVMPTGTGKTVVASMSAKRVWEDQRRPTLFLAHREELIRQAARAMSRVGLNGAVEMGRENARTASALFGRPNVVIATPQTLKGERLRSWPKDYFGQIIIDECHHVRASSYRRILDHFVDYRHMGITATPGRGDNRNLGAVYQSRAFTYHLTQAIKDGWLVPIDPLTAQTDVDLRGIAMSKGDMCVGDLAERIGPSVEQLCDVVREQIGERQGVIFTPDVASANAAAQVLTDMGVPAMYVAGESGKFGMPKAERNGLLKSFNCLEFQVVVCCDLLIEGWDCPAVSFVGNMRPTKSRFRYAQMVGRGTRPCEELGKTDCLVLDFDWKVDDDARDITSLVELYDDSEEGLSDDVIAVAKERVKAGVNPRDAVEEAEKIVRSRPNIGIRLTGVKAKYLKYRRDPSGVSKLLGIKISRSYDMDKRGDNPATEKQIWRLKSLGMDTPEGLSKWGASKMIDQLLWREKHGLARVGQVQMLLARGVDEDLARAMTAEQATQRLRESHQAEMFT